MTNNPAAPLLGDQERDEESRSNWDDSRTATAPSRASRATSQASSKRSQRQHRSDENTPLLSRGDADDREDEPTDDAEDTDDVNTSPKKSKVRWPTLIGIALLVSVVFAILGLAFAAPAVVEEYSKEAVVFKPTNLAIESFTTSGVNARVRGDFVVDGSRVRRKPIRDLGRFGTWIVSAVSSKDSTVRVFLPQYDNVELGSAQVPPVAVSVRDGQVTPIDFVATILPGEVDGIRQIANDWLENRLGSLQIKAEADVPLKSGIFSFGMQHIVQELTFEGDDVPSVPAYKIEKVLVHEVEVDGDRAMAADVAIKAFNKYPVTFNVPSMAFDVLIRGCPAVGDLVLLANATTEEIEVVPNDNVVARAQGVVRELPETLIEMCPGTDSSPLDTLLKDYLHGSKATVYVRGSSKPRAGVPSWVSDFVKDVVVPVGIPSKPFDGLVRNFTMEDTHFSLPNPLADPDTPEGSPQVSTTLRVIANLPKEMNFPVEIRQIRADADVYYKHKKLGVLDLHRWQKANSTRIYPHGDIPSGLAIDSKIVNAPLKITDNDLFSEVVQAMLFGGKNIILDVKADVDVETFTALGKFAVKGIPASGRVPIKRPGGKNFDMGELKPKIHSLEIEETTKDSIAMSAKVNMTNPTNYSATVPYVDIKILVNGTVVGHSTARDIEVKPGRNHNLAVRAVWNPVDQGGKKAREMAKNFLSQYISGRNTTLQFSTHAKTIPTLPGIGRALSNITLEIPTPRLQPPKNPNHDPDEDPEDPDDGDDEGKPRRFIQDATMHLFSSSADFTLLSPLKKSTIYLTHINATALYNHTEPIGFILYDVPFAVPPGASKTPRLPVEWDVLSVGYDAIKQAIGGTLKLDATAEVSMRLDKWEQEVWFKGGGIGAHIRP